MGGFGLARLLVYKAKTVGLCQRKMLSASSYLSGDHCLTVPPVEPST